MDAWPDSDEALIRAQDALGKFRPALWEESVGPLRLAGCFVAFASGNPGSAADASAWAAAAVTREGRLLATALAAGAAAPPYRSGLLALREGALLETVVRRLSLAPAVLLVNAVGRDHPRATGLAVQLGAMLDLPTVGVTHRPLVARGDWPADESGASSPLRLHGACVGFWLRSRRGARPVAVHAAWRTEPESALRVVRAAMGRARTPEPLRQARRLARTARAREETGA